MSKPAARSQLDTAGHVGSITVGSPNVLIGGAPAARKGDPFTCTDPQHGGSGTIVAGSKSVLINGVPAARMGDKTDCAASPSPAPVVSGAAQDQIYNATWAKNTNEDKTVKTSRPDNAKVKAFYAEAAMKDKTGDGSYDYVSAEAEVIDFTLQGMYTTESGYDVIGGGMGMEFLKAQGAAGAYGSNGIYGAEANASAAMAKGNVNMSLGDSDILRADGKASGEVLSAEAKANAELYTGGSENRYGFSAGAGAEAQVVKGELEGGISNPLFDASGKISGTAASAGAAGDGLLYVDTDDHYVRFKIAGEVALFLGLGFDLDVSLKWGWLVDDDEEPPIPPPPPIIYAGTVISGTPKVLIGE
ncbi:PAAR domain-containing protein [Cochleicola gelatinilyticus]|uniref:Uncharacterized protein n=1 Tax=Cochleicola gelatinilyticus TaxID=1763537 RepID=A0A167HLG4_9FLAO|nr:PAAR domain-containing protein [Cochleicola gelatinilyticus]OAB78738.1 hypothetical protein ULVI_09150 [Cochleicola gelatinilyticus]